MASRWVSISDRIRSPHIRCGGPGLGPEPSSRRGLGQVDGVWASLGTVGQPQLLAGRGRGCQDDQAGAALDHCQECG